MKLIERKEKLFNPFFMPECSATCERVLNFLAHIQNNFGNLFLEKKNLNGEEFFLTMPTISAFEQQIYLFEAILDHSHGKITDDQIRQFLNNFVEAHTVIWQNGIPSAKKGFYGSWTTKLEMFQLVLIENGAKTDNCPIVNELQFVIIDQLWKRKDERNSIDAKKL
jgi:hypothetical protein